MLFTIKGKIMYRSLCRFFYNLQNHFNTKIKHKNIVKWILLSIKLSMLCIRKTDYIIYGSDSS